MPPQRSRQRGWPCTGASPAPPCATARAGNAGRAKARSATTTTRASAGRICAACANTARRRSQEDTGCLVRPGWQTHAGGIARPRYRRAAVKTRRCAACAVASMITAQRAGAAAGSAAPAAQSSAPRSEAGHCAPAAAAVHDGLRTSSGASGPPGRWGYPAQRKRAAAHDAERQNNKALAGLHRRGDGALAEPLVGSPRRMTDTGANALISWHQWRVTRPAYQHHHIGVRSFRNETLSHSMNVCSVRP